MINQRKTWGRGKETNKINPKANVQYKPCSVVRLNPLMSLDGVQSLIMVSNADFLGKQDVFICIICDSQSFGFLLLGHFPDYAKRWDILSLSHPSSSSSSTQWVKTSRSQIVTLVGPSRLKYWHDRRTLSTANNFIMNWLLEQRLGSIFHVLCRFQFFRGSYLKECFHPMTAVECLPYRGESEFSELLLFSFTLL